MNAAQKPNREKFQPAKRHPGDGPLLHFADAENLTISRRKVGKTWAYFDPKDKQIKEARTVDRLNGLALPPAYRDARFNPDPHGDLQAIATDARSIKSPWKYASDRTEILCPSSID